MFRLWIPYYFVKFRIIKGWPIYCFNHLYIQRNYNPIKLCISRTFVKFKIKRLTHFWPMFPIGLNGNIGQKWVNILYYCYRNNHKLLSNRKGGKFCKNSFFNFRGNFRPSNGHHVFPFITNLIHNLSRLFWKLKLRQFLKNWYCGKRFIKNWIL